MTKRLAVPKSLEHLMEKREQDRRRSTAVETPQGKDRRKTKRRKGG